MALVLTNEQNYENIANSIRAKNGTTETYTPEQMSAAIDAIPIGSGSGDGDMTKAVYDPQGKETDVFQYIDDSLQDIVGEDGITPHIGENGNWYIGDIDTGIASRGDGIENMTYEISPDSGGVNYLYVTLSSGKEYSFPIRNGTRGDIGPTGPAGKDATVNGASDVTITSGDGISIMAKEVVHPEGGISQTLTISSTTPAWAMAENKPSYTASEVGAAEQEHSHAISDITNLQTALDGKASSSHTQSAGTISGGTFSAAVYANASAASSNYSTLMIRNSSLNSSTTTPSASGAICWTYG